MSAALKITKHLRTTKFHSPGHKTRQWEVFVESGHSIDDLLDPAYWNAVALKLTVGDRIFAMSEDATWAAMLVVREVTPTWAGVALFGPVAELTSASEKAAEAAIKRSDFETTHIVGEGYRVTRKKDGMVVAQGLSDQNAAKREVDNFIRSVARG